MKKVVYGSGPVVLCGVLAGLILWYVFFEYPLHRYRLDFNGAMWISTGKQTPHGYFAREIYVPVETADAWLQVAATDSAEVFVNGSRVASHTFVSMNVSGVDDLTGRIHRGKNVIAVYVKRSSYPGGPRLLVKGAYTDPSGNEYGFTTDDTWMISSLEELQGHGDIPWYSEQFDHSSWGAAIVEGQESTFPVYTSPVAPYLVGERLSGYWIWHPEPGVTTAHFSKSLIVRSPVKDAVIGISATSTFDVTINGITVAKGAVSNRSINIYNVTSLLHSGENTVGVGVSASEGTPGLLVEGYIDDCDSGTRLKSDHTWEAVSSIPGGEGNPAVKRLEGYSALLLASYPAEPWGVLAKELKEVDLPLSVEIKHVLKCGSFIGIVVAVVVYLWIGTAFLCAGMRNEDWADALIVDSVFHVPALLCMVFIYLLKFDVRFDPTFPFQVKTVLIAVTLIVLLRLFGVLRVAARRWTPRFSGTDKRGISGVCVFALLVGLMSAGFLIRIHELDYQSLSHDEISMVQYTQGLLERGVPFKQIGSLTKPMTTYELVPYSISLPVMLLGLNDFAVRVHSVFWGTLEILLLYLLGRALFNRATGLLAAAIYAFHPWCILWAQNAFYPQLTQVLTTLTVLLFYKAIETSPLNKKFLYATALSFSLMYLSWEGSGFLLAAMALALLAHRGSDLSWLKDTHLWTSFTIVFLTVFVQMSRRILTQDPYLVIGGRISDIGLPTLFFLDPMYSPYVYLDFFFCAENNWICTILLVAGICVAFTHRPLRYLYIMLISTVFIMTNFLQVASSRYVYHMEPFLILIGCAVGLLYLDALRTLCSEKSRALHVSVSLSGVALSVVLFAASNSTFLKLYLLSNNPSDPPTLMRQRVYWYDYRSAGQYVRENARKGDVVFAMMPHALQYYAGVKGDYGIMTLPGKTMVFDTAGNAQGFMDKYIGDPIVTNFGEFTQIVGRSHRVWLVGAPNSGVLGLNEQNAVEYIRRHFRVVYEGYGTRIYLSEK